MRFLRKRGPRAAYAVITAEEALGELRAGAILVDVRTGLEWNAGHAPGALHLPLESVGRRASELPSDARIIAVCQSGHRSAIAAQNLANRGFSVSSISGGMPAWKAAGGGVERRNPRAQ